MGAEGKKNVIERFSFETFKNATNDFVKDIVFKRGKKKTK